MNKCVKMDLNRSVIKTINDKYKLCQNGYAYTIHYVLKDTIRWRCSKYYSTNCPGKLTTDLTFKSPKIVINHNHPANDEQVQLEIFKYWLKEPDVCTNNTIPEHFETSRGQLMEDDTYKIINNYSRDDFRTKIKKPNQSIIGSSLNSEETPQEPSFEQATLSKNMETYINLSKTVCMDSRKNYFEFNKRALDLKENDDITNEVNINSKMSDKLSTICYAVEHLVNKEQSDNYITDGLIKIYREAMISQENDTDIIDYVNNDSNISGILPICAYDQPLIENKQTDNNIIDDLLKEVVNNNDSSEFFPISLHEINQTLAEEEKSDNCIIEDLLKEYIGPNISRENDTTIKDVITVDSKISKILPIQQYEDVELPKNNYQIDLNISNDDLFNVEDRSVILHKNKDIIDIVAVDSNLSERLPIFSYDVDQPPAKRRRTEKKVIDDVLNVENLNLQHPNLVEKKSVIKGNCNQNENFLFLMSLLPYLQEVPRHRKMEVRYKLQQVFMDEQDKYNYL